MRFMYLCLCLVLFLSQNGISQSSVLYGERFTEKTTGQYKFGMYLDSINKYLYRDTELTGEALSACENLLNQGLILSDSLKCNYLITQIYVRYSHIDPLGAYQIILENESVFKKLNISSKQLHSYNYIKGFTYMSIGDLEAAQKSYFEGIELGKANKDTITICKNLYSLGQLYSDEEDNEASIKCFKQFFEYAENHKMRPTTLVLAYIELSEPYIRTKEYDKALKALEQGMVIADQEKMYVLKSDILSLQGVVHLAENNIAAAEKVYTQLLELNKIKVGDSNSERNSLKLLAQLHREKKNYKEAMNVYEQILLESDSSMLHDIIKTYKNAYEVSNEMKNHETAYNYLLSYNKAKNKRDEDEKRQKTNFLKIKYDSEQKEKDNAILTAEVTKSKAERKLLYSWMGISCLFLLGLYNAFHQKRKYSKTLEAEVLKRTINLKKSNRLLNATNKELTEFNRILSHDLREPLRNIVGFSQLASREDNQPKTQEYLSFVKNSGEQLSKLIEGVNLLRNCNSINSDEHSTFSIQPFLNDIVNDVQEKYPAKQIQLMCDENPRISASQELLKPVFSNIIDNAIKYNKKEVVSIEINYKENDNEHIFEIEDNGIGIDKKYHQQVFEMFKRLNNRENYTGAGLGLSIAKRLIEKINGNIQIVRSSKEAGSTFLISFPGL